MCHQLALEDKHLVISDASDRSDMSDRSDVSDRSDKSERSEESDKSEKSDAHPQLLLPHGGYRRLRSFQVAERVYDGTVCFCRRFVPAHSRTCDQMVQAARSGRQNIAEGSMASATSTRTEFKLTNVARASLEELLLDYEDFLRQRHLPRWPKDSPAALAVRNRFRSVPVVKISDSSDISDLSDRSKRSEESEATDPYHLATAPPETAANTLICLTSQAIWLLGRQLDSLQQAFLDHGGFTERLCQARLDRRRGMYVH